MGAICVRRLALINGNGVHEPCKDVLRVVVAQVDLGRPTDRDAASLHVDELEIFGLCEALE